MESAGEEDEDSGQLGTAAPLLLAGAGGRGG